MPKRFRGNIEFYDALQRGKRMRWRLGAVLYAANIDDPFLFRQAVEGLVEAALIHLKASGVRYWYNSVRIAGMLVAGSANGEYKVPTLYPCTQVLPTADYVIRVRLAPDEQLLVAGYRVAYGTEGLLESMSLDETLESQP